MTASTGSPLRVLIIVENLPVPFDRRVWAEATTLTNAGYEVSVISPALRGYDASYEKIDGVHVYRHPIYQAGLATGGYLREYFGALYWQFRLAMRIWRQRGFDVIHACNPPDLIFFVALFFKIFGVRFIFDHHDLCPELYESKFKKRGLLWRLLFVVERATFWAADISIATNESYKRIAIRRGRMRARDVFVVRSGPRLEKLELRPPRVELKRGAEFLIGYVGVIGQQEGLDLLIEAAEKIVRKHGPRKAHFAIIGDGPSLQEAMALVREKDLEANFTFTGRASDDLLLDTLNTADICVNSDRWSAMNDMSTMNKVMEYMALQKPIVQFELYEGRQSAGEASLYARPDDAADFAEKIEYLMQRPCLRVRMGKIGRQRIVDQLSWSHSAPTLLAAYARVFAEPGGNPASEAATAPSLEVVNANAPQ